MSERTAHATTDPEAILARVLDVFRREVPEKTAGVPLGRDSDLRADLGLDSGYFIGLLVALEDEFDVELDTTDVSHVESLGDVARLVTAALAAAGRP